MSDEPDTASAAGDVVGLVVVVITLLVVAGAWLAWESRGDFLAENFDYITKDFALKHLQKPDCNLEEDILAVDEINDTSPPGKYEKGKRVEMRSVIYQFRRRPLNGPVSADVLRDTQTLYKDAQGHWKASCER